MTTVTEDWSFKSGDLFTLPTCNTPDYEELVRNISFHAATKFMNTDRIGSISFGLVDDDKDIFSFFFNEKLGNNAKIIFLGYSQKHPETMGLFINTEGRIQEIELLFFEEEVVGYLQKVEGGSD